MQYKQNESTHSRNCRLILNLENLKYRTEGSSFTLRNGIHVSESHSQPIPSIMSRTPPGKDAVTQEEETIYVQIHFSERTCRESTESLRVCRSHSRTSTQNIAALSQHSAYSCSTSELPKKTFWKLAHPLKNEWWLTGILGWVA